MNGCQTDGSVREHVILSEFVQESEDDLVGLLRLLEVDDLRHAGDGQPRRSWGGESPGQQVLETGSGPWSALESEHRLRPFPAQAVTTWLRPRSLAR